VETDPSPFESVPGTTSGRHFAGTNTQFIVKYLRSRASAGTVERVLARAGETRTADVLADPVTWSSYDEFRNLLVAVEAELGTDALTAIGLDAFSEVSVPESTAMLQALGSPSSLYADIGPAAASLTPVIELWGVEQGPTEWLMHQRFKPGYEPFRQYCPYSLGLLGVTPRLFGYLPATVVEEACQCDGAPECVFRVKWEPIEEATRRAEQLEVRVQVLQGSLEALQITVGDLVSGEDLEEVLARIISSAARSVRAPGFVLAIEAGLATAKQVYFDGVTPEEAEVIAAELLDGRRETDDMCLVVELASTRRSYGRLAALNQGGRFYSQELATLHAYGRLAAAALDSAAALEETRSQATRAEALLALSSALADLASGEDMAQRIAQAVPAVIDCDRAIVAVAEDARTGRITGVCGYPDDVAKTLIGRTFAFGDSRQPDLHIEVPTPSPNGDGGAQKFMDWTGTAAVASYPIISNGEVLGYISAGVTERPERLTKSVDLETRLRGLAGQAATALNNAALLDQVRRQALHDGLTGLPNRTALTKRLAASFGVGSDRRARHESVLFIDVDDFKDVNDSLGHDGGDELLTQLGDRLNSCVRAHDLVARLGGDEFAIVVIEDEGDATAVEVAERILASLRTPFVVNGDRLSVSVSIGIAQRRPEIADAAELLRRADFAMYMAKGGGKSRYQIFDAKMHDNMLDRAALKADLANAVLAGQLRLDYQPVADLRTGEVVGVEALVRWQHPTMGLLAPAAFIGLAEETGDIDAIGCWVLDTATRQAAAWRDAMPHCSELWVSVNLSALQLPNPHSLAAINAILADPSTRADRVVFEVTETALADDIDGAIAALNALKRSGARIAIDDFGTGYSSLSTLANLPADILKIDRSFVSGRASHSIPMLEGILGLASNLSLEIVAEGIEQHEQLDLLRSLGCGMGQGFLLCRPMSASAIETLLGAGGLIDVSPRDNTDPVSRR